MLDLVFSPSAAAVVGTSEELWHDTVVRWTLTALVDRCVICRSDWYRRSLTLLQHANTWLLQW